jgi:hypothetical protein
MIYIYHSLPENMTGTMLYPLSELAVEHPQLFNAHEQKYTKRPRVLTNAIPHLGCFWNDVLHFTAVHPEVLKEVLARAGYTKPLHYVQVNPMLLSKEKTIIFLNKVLSSGAASTTADDFVAFDPETVDKYATIPLENEQYYKENLEKGDEFLIYHGIPHILYKGRLDIGGMPIITV